MKRKNLALLSIVITLLYSCSKDPVVSTDERVGISRITYFPTITLTGADVISVIKGTTFTDPGVKATAGGADVPVTVVGDVNTGAVGLYTLTYGAVNSDGFSSSATRTVIVIPSAEVAGPDITGNYLPVPQGATPGGAVVTKLAQGVYYITNCWGGGSTAIIPAYFISVDGTNLIIPEQLSAGNIIRTDPPPAVFDGSSIVWTVNRLNFPGGPLILQKKWQKQ